MKLRSNSKKFIQKAKKIHDDRYDYSKTEYSGSINKIIIICKKHGEFIQRANNHLNGQGCPKCRDEIRWIFLSSNTEEFIKKAIEIHGDKYDYSKVEYKGNNTNIIIICKKHGEFLQSPHGHLSNRGCLKCGKENAQKLMASNNEKFILKAIGVHGKKYIYSKINYFNNRVPIIIICKKHGEFLQKPHEHLNGHGCIKCVNFISKSSQKWLDLLGIPTENREKIIYVNNKKYIVDAYNPEINTIYEFNGDYWHGNPDIFNLNDIHPTIGITFGELYHKTIEKQTILINAGYNIISIWESDFKKSTNKEILI